MTDAVRTLTSLQSLLADNSTQAISPQDLRDAIYSALAVLPYRATSTGITLGQDDCVVGVTTGSSADVTILLPTVAAARTGKLYVLVKVDSGNKTIIADGASSETINGATTKAVATQWSALALINTGSAWLGLTLTGA